MKSKILVLSIALLSGRAFGAPHLEPCNRLDGYEERVERLLRDAWPEQLKVLVVIYLPLRERGIGVTSGKDGFSLVRLELDKSLYYSSVQSTEPGADLDFSRARARVAKLAVPISDRLGRALLDLFQRSADAAKSPQRSENEEILADGYKFEVLLAKRPCVQLANPPEGSMAYQIDRLVRFLDYESPHWRPEEREEFERSAMELIPH